MSSREENFQKQKDILRQIARASESIRRKHRLIKLGKETVERTLSDTFKPIVNPLEKIVGGLKNIKKKDDESIKRKEKSKSKVEESIDDDDDDDLSYKSINDEEEADVTADTSNLELSTRSEAESKSETPTSSWIDDDANKYLILLGERSRELDNVYGVRKLTKDRLMIGDSEISFTQNYIHVGNLNFPKSKGLLELLFKKVPQESSITSSDLENYRQIIIATNTYKKHYKPDGEIRDDKTFKYKNFIKKLILTSPSKNTDRQNKKRKSSSSGKGMIPQNMIAREGSLMDYIYWDDPNELVDRLRLLLASQAAGNPSHTNEIISIIEELREAGFIY